MWLEITNLVIPGENDSGEEIDRMTQWISDRLGPDVPLHFSAFHPAWKMMDRPRTPPSTLRRAREIARANGLRYVYTGNVVDPEGSATYCPACGEALIRRAGYALEGWDLAFVEASAVCASCATPVAGVFEHQPGRWGARMQPIFMGA